MEDLEDPIKKKIGFMKIKSEKQDSVFKCGQMVKNDVPRKQHDHPECWAMIRCVEMEFDIIVTDIRRHV